MVGTLSALPTLRSPRYLLIPRIEIVARRRRRCRYVVVGARAVRPAAAARETLAAIAFEPARGAIDLRLRSGDERRQTVDAAIVRDSRLRVGLRVGLELRLGAMFARLMLLFARLVGLALALMIARAVVARHERLRLHRDEAGLLPEMRKTLALVVAILRGHFILGARLRLVLTELLLGSGDQAEIVFGVLVVILGRHRIAGRARIARQLHIFFRDVGRGAADLDIGSVRLEHPGQQRRAPQQSSADRWLHQIIPPAKTSTGFSRDLSSAISGFRSLCGRTRRSTLKPSRSSRPAFRNLSLGAGSRSENPGLHPQYLPK